MIMTVSRAGAVEPLSTPEETATLLRVIEADELDPVSVDPTGIAYLPGRDRLLVVDSEIDETPLFTGDNLWELGRSLTTIRSGSTPDPAERIEPTGLAYDSAAGRLFVTNDRSDSVFVLRPGPDGVFGSADDTHTEFSTLPFGSRSPADVSFDSREGDLYLLDFVTTRIHRIEPGRDGAFDGAPPDGDDVVTTIAVPAGVVDAEGLGYRRSSDTLIVIDSGSDARLFEITKEGALIRTIDIAFLRRSDIPLRPSDVEFAPASSGKGTSLYITDRGTDSAELDSPDHPQDGRIYELSAPFVNTPPVVSAGPDLTLSLSESATLRGSVHDDGQPDPNGVSVSWSVEKGPGGVAFGAPAGLETVVSFNRVGTYVLRLRASDGLLSGSDSLVAEVVTSASGRFLDDDGSIFEEDIEWLAARGITKGCNPPINNLFCPKDGVTRGQMAAFLVRAIQPSAPGSDSFRDDDSSVFEGDIDDLAAAGITRGCNPPANDRFCPDEHVTRGQMAAFLVRALDLDSPQGDPFTDDDESVFERDIESLAAAGITRGCNPPVNDRFCPDDMVTREQMAAFLRRALE
jgi:DNA-binding beta-propeller fold protein YncE